MIALLALLALADPVAQASAAELVRLAGMRMDERDYEGGRVLLDQALDRPGADVDAILYLRGISWELDGDPARAIRLYDEGLARWPTGPLADDRIFRKAESLGALDLSEEALDVLDTLRVRDLAPLDAGKYRLVEGALLLQVGREGRGLRRLRRALSDVPRDALTFYRAKARAAVADHLARESAALHLDVGPRRQRRRLRRRAVLISDVERQVTTIADLAEPEWVMAGLLALAGAYEQLGDDLVTHRRPSLTPEQAEIYEEEIRARVETVWVKATRAHQLGLDLAGRVHWDGRRVDALAEAKQRVIAKIDAL